MRRAYCQVRPLKFPPGEVESSSEVVQSSPFNFQSTVKSKQSLEIARCRPRARLRRRLNKCLPRGGFYTKNSTSISIPPFPEQSVEQ